MNSGRASWFALALIFALGALAVLPAAPVVAQEPEWAYCPDHDPTKWHALYDEARNCWYDHHHGDDPRQVDDVFGDWYMNLTATEPGNEIDPFWNPQPGDNAHHMTMHWFAGKRECVSPKFASGSMSAWRVLAHYQSDSSDFVQVVDGAPIGTFHTVWAEFETCLIRDDGTVETGIIRYGGAQYAGDIFVDGDVVFDFPDLRELFPGTKSPRALVLTGCNLAGPRFQTWYNSMAEGLVRVAVQIDDSWGSGCFDPANPTVVPFNEGANQSKTGLHLLGADIRRAVVSRLDPDGDGYVDGMWYLTEIGTFNDECTDIGPNCIPIYYEHVPIPPDSARQSHYQLRLGTTEYDSSIRVLPASPLTYPGDKE